MSKEIFIKLSEKAAKGLANISLSQGWITKEQYEEKVREWMEPQKALFGG